MYVYTACLNELRGYIEDLSFMALDRQHQMIFASNRTMLVILTTLGLLKQDMA